MCTNEIGKDQNKFAVVTECLPFQGRTPLHMAAECHHCDAITVLLKEVSLMTKPLWSLLTRLWCREALTWMCIKKIMME